MTRTLQADIKQTPYWQDSLGPLSALTDAPPAEVDLLIIGSGYTGLNAALVGARGGMKTLVLDAQDAGFGCSTRNGGQISTSVKPSLSKLTQRFGAAKALAIRREGEEALRWIAEFTTAEGIDCDFRHSGRFHAAHTPEAYETLARDAERLSREEGIESFAVPRRDQRRELGSDSYFGGVVFTKHCALQPAKYHRGLMLRVLAAGAEIVPHCKATKIERRGTGFVVHSAKGQIAAKQVVVATNGYTGDLLPWLQRRVIPIGSYLIATEELPEALVDELFPTDRIASDTCKVLYYYRASPDRRRIVFGGRVSAYETDTDQSGPLLRQKMVQIFPQLRDAKITHSWSGQVAYSFDELAHTGVQDGVHYALGYCGSGVSMASYLGMRIGQKVLGMREGITAFDGMPHPTRPFYRGKPWFLPAAVSLYRWRDQRECSRALKAG